MAKNQQKLIAGYEQVFQYLNQRKDTLKKERDQKSAICEQLLTRVKSEYENELRDIRLQNPEAKTLSRSVSPAPNRANDASVSESRAKRLDLLSLIDASSQTIT